MKPINDLLSFFYPVRIETRAGTVSPYLEITKYKGKCLLNSRTVNYSFGGLHSIFEQLFEKITLSKFRFKNILILGMGGGSIISLLRETYGINCPITAIEKDSVVIELARKYFNVEKYHSLKIVQDDAYMYILKSEEKYDLIISDLFIDANVPGIFASNEYLFYLKKISTERCCIIYNKMTTEAIHKQELNELIWKFKHIFPGAEVHKLYVSGSENSLLYYNTLSLL